MPNIFKSFLRPSADRYVLPDVDELQMPGPEPEPEPVQEPAEEASPERSALEGEAQTIRFAEVQAEKILEEARRQGEQILSESRAKAEQEAEEQKEAARTEGFRQGYAEGLEHAKLEARRKLDEQLEQEGRQIQDFLEKATAAREALMDRTKDELRDLSIAIAEKVIQVSLKSSSEVIARMIQTATEKLKRREWVHIYLSERDAKGVAQAAPELMTALASLSDHVKLIPMGDDEPGTCIIEMPDEIIDASAATQLSNIREQLRDG